MCLTADAYGEDCFKFTDNFIRITLPISAHDHASDHASVQVEKLVSIYSTYHKIKKKYHFCILYDRLRRTFFISPKRLGYRSRGWCSEEIMSPPVPMTPAPKPSAAVW